MNCFVCAQEQRDTVAVAVCRHCGAAMCLRHVRKEASSSRPGAMSTTCTHDLWCRSVSSAPGPVLG